MLKFHTAALAAHIALVGVIPMFPWSYVLKTLLYVHHGPKFGGPYFPKTLHSQGPMFPRPYVFKVLCSQSPMFQVFYVAKTQYSQCPTVCSQGPMFPRFYVPTVPSLEGPMSPRSYVSKDVSRALCSNDPMFPGPYCMLWEHRVRGQGQLIG